MKRAREPVYSTKEVAAIFGYASTASLHNAVLQRCFPKPDQRFTGLNATREGRGVRARVYWRKSTIEKEKARRAAKTKD